MSSYQPDPFSTDPDRHSIETPEQVDLDFQIAGIGSRFLAVAIDMLIQGATVLLLSLVFSVMFLKTGISRWLPMSTPWAVATLIAVLFLLYFGYFALFEMFWHGQTIGKKVTGIRVLKDSGRPLHAFEVVARNLLRIVDQMPGFYGVGIVVALLNRNGKRLGDMVAGSMVVRDSSSAQSAAAWSPSSGALSFSSPLGAAELTPQEAGLIERFLVRRSDLTPGVRDKMARDMVVHFRQKLPSLAANARTDPERLLVMLFEEYRSQGRI